MGRDAHGQPLRPLLQRRRAGSPSAWKRSWPSPAPRTRCWSSTTAPPTTWRPSPAATARDFDFSLTPATWAWPSPATPPSAPARGRSWPPSTPTCGPPPPGSPGSWRDSPPPVSPPWGAPGGAESVHACRTAGARRTWRSTPATSPSATPRCSRAPTSPCDATWCGPSAATTSSSAPTTRTQIYSTASWPGATSAATSRAPWPTTCAGTARRASCARTGAGCAPRSSARGPTAAQSEPGPEGRGQRRLRPAGPVAGPLRRRPGGGLPLPARPARLPRRRPRPRRPEGSRSGGRGGRRPLRRQRPGLARGGPSGPARPLPRPRRACGGDLAYLSWWGPALEGIAGGPDRRTTRARSLSRRAERRGGPPPGLVAGDRGLPPAPRRRRGLAPGAADAPSASGQSGPGGPGPGQRARAGRRRPGRAGPHPARRRRTGGEHPLGPPGAAARPPPAPLPAPARPPAARSSPREVGRLRRPDRRETRAPAPAVQVETVEGHRLGWMAPGLLQQSLLAGAVVLWGDGAVLGAIPCLAPGTPRSPPGPRRGQGGRPRPRRRAGPPGRLPRRRGLAPRPPGLLPLARRSRRAPCAASGRRPRLPPDATAERFVSLAGDLVTRWLFTWEGAAPSAGRASPASSPCAPPGAPVPWSG